MIYDKKWAEDKAKELDMEVENTDKARMIIEALNKTDGYCPCVPKYCRNEDTICICKEARVDGKCRCELFKKKSI